MQAVGEVARPLELYRKEEGRRDVYYYSKFREGGRVVSEYVGGGHIATL